jgi:hypothetical protein
MHPHVIYSFPVKRRKIGRLWPGVPACDFEFSSLMAAKHLFGSQAVPFLHQINTVYGGDLQGLFCPARPVNFDGIDLASGSQPEVHTQIRTRTVTRSAEYVSTLPHAA